MAYCRALDSLILVIYRLIMGIGSLCHLSYMSSLAAFASFNRMSLLASGLAEKRPNILFAFADDWGNSPVLMLNWSLSYAKYALQTRHFDRIAEQGVLFTNTFVNSPSAHRVVVPCSLTVF